MSQIAGSPIDISTLHLTAPGLYVSLPRYDTSLPASTPELEKVVPTLLIDNLSTLRSYVLYMKETIVQKQRETIDTNKSALGKHSNDCNLSEMSYWTRPTYYTPPKDTASKVPQFLYGTCPASNLMEKLLKASFDSSNTETVNACEFGWMKKEGRYYNVYTEEYSEKHICCND